MSQWKARPSCALPEDTRFLTSPSTRRVHVQCHWYEKVAAAGNVDGFTTLQDYNNLNNQNEKCSVGKMWLLLSLFTPPLPHPCNGPSLRFRTPTQPLSRTLPCGSCHKYHFRRDKHVFCRDKSMLAATKRLYNVCRDKNDTCGSSGE